MQQVQKIEISAKTIIFAVLFVLFLFFVWLIKDLIFSLLIAFILMSALKPVVYKLISFRMPRLLAVIVVYLSFLFLLGFLVSIIVPPILSELGMLIHNLPIITRNLTDRFGEWIDLGSLSQYLPDVTNQILHVIGNLFSNAVFLISTLFFGFYFLLEEGGVRGFFAQYAQEPTMAKINSVLDRSEKRLANWFWGELTLMFVVGLLSGVGFSLIGMKYVLALAVLAGLLEVVPTIGPVTAAVPAVLIGVSHSYFMGFSALAVSIIVQQLENHLIVPIVMRKVIGINPVVTLIVLIIGGRIAGLLGILLAIPLFLIMETLATEFLRKQKVAEKMR